MFLISLADLAYKSAYIVPTTDLQGGDRIKKPGIIG